MVKRIDIDTVEMEISGVDMYLRGTTDSLLIKNGMKVGYIQNRLKIRSSKRGAHNIHVRTFYNGTKLLIEGSFYGYLHGQNTYTTNNLRALCVRVANKVNKLLIPHYGIKVYKQISQQITLGNFKLYRVDLAVNYRMESERQVKQVLRNLKHKLVSSDSNFHGRGTSVAYTPRNAVDYSICLYAKGAELRRKQNYVPQSLIKDCENILRIEVRLKTKELSRQNVEYVSQWSEITPDKLFSFYLPRLKFLKIDGCALSSPKMDAIPAKHQLIYHVWNKGILSPELFNPRTWYRYQKIFKEYGIDINTPIQYQGETLDLNALLSSRAISEPLPWIKPKDYLSF